MYVWKVNCHEFSNSLTAQEAERTFQYSNIPRYTYKSQVSMNENQKAPKSEQKMKFLLFSCLVLICSAQRGPKCSDGSRPSCSDGNRRQRGVGCSDGNKPTCEDGTSPTKPSPCSDGSIPTCGGSDPVCPDGSALDTSSFPPCTGGRPVCSDGTTQLTCADGSSPRGPPGGGRGGQGGRGGPRWQAWWTLRLEKAL